MIAGASNEPATEDYAWITGEPHPPYLPTNHGFVTEDVSGMDRYRYRATSLASVLQRGHLPRCPETGRKARLARWHFVDQRLPKRDPFALDEVPVPPL